MPLPGATRVIPLPELLGRMVRAMVRPDRAFADIRSHERIPCCAWLLVALAGGLVYALLHFRVVDDRWLWSYSSLWFSTRLLNALLASPGNWLLAVCGIKVIARLCGKPVTVQWAEVAACYLWWPWAIMPLVDVLHPLFGIPSYSVAVPSFLRVPGVSGSLVWHVAWLVAFPCLLAELTALFGFLLAGVRGRWGWAVGLAVACLGTARLVLETTPERMIHALGPLGYSIDVWTASVWMTALSVIWLAGWWLSLTIRPRWAMAVCVLLAGVSLICYGFWQRFELWG